PSTKLRTALCTAAGTIPGPCPWDNNHGNPVGFLGAWTAAAYDSLRNRTYVFGGGHADSSINSMCWYDWNASGAMTCTARTQNTLPTDIMEVYPDGRPVSRH